MQFDGKNFHIQNIPPLSILKEFGSPLYVYDAQIIERQWHTLNNAFSKVPKLRINYAVKALTNLAVLRYLHQLGSCADCVSIEEVKLCLKAGFLPSQIGYTPAGVMWSEIEEAVSLGVGIHLDSLPLLRQFGEKYGASIPVGIRLNPQVMDGGNLKISTAHEKSKFGISILHLPEIQAIMQETGIVIEGLHQHTGSEIKYADTFLKVAEIIFNAAKQFPDLTYLDLGGGFKVPYKSDETGTDMSQVGSAIADRFNQFCADYGRELTLVFEPGKFLVAEAGYFFATVTVVKENPAVTFAQVDSGLNHLVRPMMYGAYHEILNISNPLKDKKLYHVSGYICETDNFAEDRLLPEITEGEVLCLTNAGAYCYTMSSNYNSRPRPAEVMVYNGKTHLVRERETFEDLTKGQHFDLDF